LSGIKDLIQEDAPMDDIQIAKTIEVEKPLYTVLEEVPTEMKEGQLFQASHGYQLPKKEQDDQEP